MKQTDKIECPFCKEVQSEDIHDLTEGGDLEGQFKHECENCEKEFTVEFEFVAKIQTY